MTQNPTVRTCAQGQAYNLGPTHLRLPSAIEFGVGVAGIVGEVARQYGRRVAICSDTTVLDVVPTYGRVVDELNRCGIEITGTLEALPDVPLESIARCAKEVTGPVDSIIAIGGGSVIDTAKLVSLQLSHPGPLDQYYGESAIPGPCLPVIAIPTTAGTGSEVSPVAVLTNPKARLKVGIASWHLVPSAALCDPEATTSCPPATTAYCGMDALVHALEAFTSRIRPHAWKTYNESGVFKGKNPFSDIYATTAVQWIVRDLEKAVHSPTDLDARTSVLFGSLCAGIAFSHAGTAATHALQYPIGALTGTPHGLGIAILAPYVLSYIQNTARTELAQLARAIGTPVDGDAAAASWMVREVARIGESIGIPETLESIGVEERDLPKLGEEAATVTRLMTNSPMDLTASDLQAILEHAMHGGLTDTLVQR